MPLPTNPSSFFNTLLDQKLWGQSLPKWQKGIEIIFPHHRSGVGRNQHILKICKAGGKNRCILQRDSSLSEYTFSAAVALCQNIFPFPLCDSMLESALQRSFLPSPTSHYSLHLLSYTEQMMQKG